MKLSKYKDVANAASSKASEINRKLAFAGIAVCWIFRIEASDAIKIPDEITLPIILFVLTLGIDLFHYILRAVIWSIFYGRMERIHKNEEDPDVEANVIWPYLINCVFVLKIVTGMVAYLFLLKYLITILI